jgi:hypothetical protein
VLVKSVWDAGDPTMTVFPFLHGRCFDALGSLITADLLPCDAHRAIEFRILSVRPKLFQSGVEGSGGR